MALYVFRFIMVSSRTFLFDPEDRGSIFFRNFCLFSAARQHWLRKATVLRSHGCALLTVCVILISYMAFEI
jgi:hypothetical protein